jgi:hypothetical protein
MLQLLTTAGGSLVIVAITWEVFQDLFHPAHSGALSDWLGRRIFNALRRYPPMLPLAGAAALVTVIAAWVLFLIIGFGLVYYGYYPAQFRTSLDEVPASSSRALSVLYFSFQTLITLGYGDLLPHTMPMRFVASLEGLIGFGLLTASVSTLVLLYPALSRMRLLARGVAHIVAAEQRTGVTLAASGSDVVLSGLARDVTNARIDLVHFPIVYYFAVGDENASLAHWAPELIRLAHAGIEDGNPKQVRLAAAALDAALDDLAQLLRERFVPDKSLDRESVFRAFARDQVTDPV